MAKPTKYATPICLGLTVLAAIGVAVGLATKEPLFPLIALLPAVGYEAYRTEGESTRWASWAMVVAFVALLALFIFDIDFDLASFFGASEKYIAGQRVPLGDIKVVGGALMVALGVILFTRTRGIYTRWLAVVIFLASFSIVYLVSPETFQDLVRSSADQVGG